MSKNLMTTSAAPLALEIKYLREQTPRVSSEVKPVSKYRILRTWESSFRYYTDPYLYLVQKRCTFLIWSWWKTISRHVSEDAANKAFEQSKDESKRSDLIIREE